MSTATLPPPARPAKAEKAAKATLPSPTPTVAKLDPLDAEQFRHRFTPEDYDLISEAGVLDRLRTRLVDGHILAMPAVKVPHAVSQSAVNDELRGIFAAKSYWVRDALPIIVPGEQPEPDCSVVAGTRRSWQARPHPAAIDVLLAVEVADSTLRLDRWTMAGMYAFAGIADYWIVNLIDRVLEVHRNPVPDAAWPFGHRYADVRVLDANASVSPLAMPNTTVKVVDLFS